MKTSSFSIARKDDEMTELVGATGRKTLALRAIACANRVMPFFEENRPEDSRPSASARNAGEVDCDRDT